MEEGKGWRKGRGRGESKQELRRRRERGLEVGLQEVMDEDWREGACYMSCLQVGTFSDALTVREIEFRVKGRLLAYLRETSSSTISPLSGHSGGGFLDGGNVSSGASGSICVYSSILSTDTIWVV